MERLFQQPGVLFQTRTEKFAIGAEGEEQGLEEPFKTSKPVFPGSRYVFNLSLFGVPLLVQ